jgi:hypothetical protein
LTEFGTQHCDRKNRPSTAGETKRVLNKHFLRTRPVKAALRI